MLDAAAVQELEAFVVKLIVVSAAFGVLCAVAVPKSVPGVKPVMSLAPVSAKHTSCPEELPVQDAVIVSVVRVALACLK